MRLAIVTTHPVQYNAPWFRMLAESPGISLRVFYTWHTGTHAVHDPGFGQAIAWDLPLTDGYDFEWAAPTSAVQRRTFWNMDSPTLNSQIQQFGPDAILVIGWNYRSHFRAMRQFHGKIPILFRGDSTLLDQRGGFREQLRRTWLSWVYRHVDYALSVGTNNDQYFLHHGLHKRQVVRVPHAVDNQRFGDDDADRCEQAIRIRRELGFSDQNVVMMFIGKFEPKKCPGLLLRAFRHVADSRPELRLLFVGNGVLEAELTTANGEDPRVQFLPFQNQLQMPMTYRIGDVTILPSDRNETWGLCLNESMAAGRTVVATHRVGAAADLVRHGLTGYICECDFDSLVRVLSALPERIKLMQMGSHCRQFIRDWSFSAIVTAISELLMSLKPAKSTEVCE